MKVQTSKSQKVKKSKPVWTFGGLDVSTFSAHSAFHMAVTVVLCLCGSRLAHAEIRVEVTKINGSTVSGWWMPVSDAGKIAVRTKIRQEIFSEDDLISVRFVVGARHAVPVRWSSQPEDWDVTVWCNDGSLFPADILEGGAGEAGQTRCAGDLLLKTPFAERVKVGLNDITALKWNRHQFARDDHMDDRIDAYLTSRKDSKDVLVVLHENRSRTLQGTIETISPQGGSFNYRGRSLKFDSSRTYALILAGLKAQKAAPAICVLNDGYRLAGHIIETTADTVLLSAVSGLTIALPVLTIQEIRFSSSRVVYLSDLQPADMQQHSLFDIHWPVRFNRAVSNQPMSMKGRRYSKGIGVHAHSEITYHLEGNYRSLAATIGIDDRTRPSGQVVFRVLGDGKELFNSRAITGQDDPQDILVNLAGVGVITLVVEQAEQLDIGDHANWANARLLK